jgi:TonB-dependent SusC/RagA subfamily outer membrane receptor
MIMRGWNRLQSYGSQRVRLLPQWAVLLMHAGLFGGVLLWGRLPLEAQIAYGRFTPPTLEQSDVIRQPDKHATAGISLTVRDSTLAYVIREVARQAHKQLSYDGSAVTLSQRVTVHIVHATLPDALAAVFKGTSLTATMAADGETIVVQRKSSGATNEGRQSASGTVMGRVTDSATGRGLGGAAVKVQGTKISAVTSDSGRFVLHNVPVGDQVVSIRLFGYQSATRVVTVKENASVSIRVVMASVPTVLSGMVTTATGMQRKLELGNDITTLNVDSIRKVAPITSVTDLLESRVPGLTVLHSSGTPGAPSRIRLRGAGSISENNDPIVIVDGVRVYAAQSDSRNSGFNGYGVPSPLDQIDPNSIETIEVFKGPSASSMYGADAANGVIVVTTKHGHTGPTHWDAELGAGLNYEPGDWPVNYYRFGWGPSSTIGTSVYNPFCAWNDLSCAVDSIVPFQALNDPRYTLFADHGSDQTANLTVSGGVASLLYSLTGSASRTLGILKLPGIEQERYQKFYQASPPEWMLRPDNYTTYGGSGQLTANPSPSLQVTMHANLFSSHRQTSTLQDGIGQLEGEYVFADQLDQSPLITGEFQRITDAQLSWTNSLSINWRPLSWLPISATAGLNSMDRTDESLLPYGINPTSAGAYISSSTDTMGAYGLGRGNVLMKTVTAYTTVSPDGLLKVTVGGNLQSQSIADVTAYTILSPGVSSPTQFPTTPPGASSFGQQKQSTSTYGWYIEPRLNVLSRFFVSPGLRLDGGSASGSHAGLTGFPKIDFSYVAVDRQGERPLWGVLSLLRPRIAYGYAGVQPGPADKLRLFEPGCHPCDYAGAGAQVALDGSTYVTPVTLTTLGNTKLRPERSSELEGGFEADLWRSRLELSFSQYNKVRHNAIIALPVAPSVVGQIGSQLVNIGVVRNTGTEVSVTARPLDSRVLSWSVSAQWSHNTNKLVRINAGFSPIINVGNGTGIVPGYPLFGRWALPIVTYADVDHNGVIDGDEVQMGDSAVYLGASDPNYQLSMNTNFVLGGRLSVTANITYQNGLNQFNSGGAAGLQFLPNQPGTSLANEAAVVADGGGGGLACWNGCVDHPSDIGLMQTVSTLRFNSLSVNYIVPVGFARVFRMPRMSVALQGENLGLHTNYRGKDPNVNAFSTVQKASPGSTGGDQVQDTGQLPEPRTWWLKVTLGN